jgi:hypothetical protein
MLSSKTKYLVWNGMSSFCSSVSFTLSTSSILSVIQSNPLQLGLISGFITKDIIGQFTGSLYSFHKSKVIDNNISSFASKGLILEQSSLYINMVIPLLPVSYYFPVASLSSILINISFTFLGAINAKSMYNLTTNKNSSEIYTHLNIVNTLSTTLGMLTGVGIINYINDPIIISLILFKMSIGRFFCYKKALTFVY